MFMILRATGGVLLALGAVFATAGVAAARKPEIYQSAPTQQATRLAVGGFDTVAYHTQRFPVPGSAAFRVGWKGAEWRFSSAENRDLFVKAPGKYAPQFGGYCAYAVAFGATAPGDPRVFTLVGDKLYLNLNKEVQSSWARNREALIRKAEKNWPGVLK
ncbi:MAG: YHS domain-containing (seleno)protein [Hyphomicrobiaceae bacterium]